MSESNKLIEGVFEPDEAAELLIALINNKLQFHTLKAFSSEERDGTVCEQSRRRIESLNKTKEHVLGLIAEASKRNRKVTIDSTLDIRING